MTRLVAGLVLLSLGSCASSAEGGPPDPTCIDCPSCFGIIDMLRSGPRHPERTIDRFHQDQCAACGTVLTFSMCDGRLMVARSGSDAWLSCELCSPPPAPAPGR